MSSIFRVFTTVSLLCPTCTQDSSQLTHTGQTLHSASPSDSPASVSQSASQTFTPISNCCYSQFSPKHCGSYSWKTSKDSGHFNRVKSPYSRTGSQALEEFKTLPKVTSLRSSNVCSTAERSHADSTAEHSSLIVGARQPFIFVSFQSSLLSAVLNHLP